MHFSYRPVLLEVQVLGSLRWRDAVQIVVNSLSLSFVLRRTKIPQLLYVLVFESCCGLSGFPWLLYKQTSHYEMFPVARTVVWHLQRDFYTNGDFATLISSVTWRLSRVKTRFIISSHITYVLQRCFRLFRYEAK